MTKHAVGAVDDFAEGAIEIVEVGSRPVGIVNAGDAFYAVLNVCPHALAPVCEGRLTGTMLPSHAGEAKWGLAGRVLRCPWHGYEFNLEDEGRAVYTNYRARVRMFPVSVEDGTVYVHMGRRAT